jgi:hypothetical protein
MIKKSLIIFLILHGFAVIADAQDIPYSPDDEPFVQMAISEISKALTPPNGSLYLFAVEKKLEGSYSYDLTIRNKGEMATVFAVSSEGGTITMQNLLKDRLKAFRFTFKMPKGKSFKFQYTFQFN